MTPIVKQRLIGSILLLCALGGVAFFLISSATDDVVTTPDVEMDIPFTSTIDMSEPDGDIAVELVEPEQETLVISTESISEAMPTPIIVVEPSPVEEIPQTASKNGAELPSWSLQIAAVSVEESAESLRKQIDALGYKATVEKIETEKGNIFRVRIGPEQDKLALEATAKKLKESLNLNPQLLKQN